MFVSSLMCVCPCIVAYAYRKNQLDATEWFIALVICSTCFGHFYAHHQELETICLLLPPMVYMPWLLVVGGQVHVVGYESGMRDVARLVVLHPLFRTHSLLPAPDLRQPVTKACTP